VERVTLELEEVKCVSHLPLRTAAVGAGRTASGAVLSLTSQRVRPIPLPL
jgi:hypothetical protein